jgi:hypothetical protein
MKKTTKITIVALMVALAFNSCNKYEDGPLISFRSPLNRLIGQWEVYYFEMNGNDLTQLYKDSCNCNFSFINKKSTLYFRYYNCIPNYGFSGDLKLFDNESKIQTSTGITYKENQPNDTVKYFQIIGDLTFNIWDIKRLKYKDLWVTCNSGNIIYFIKLTKIGNDEE